MWSLRWPTSWVKCGPLVGLHLNYRRRFRARVLSCQYLNSVSTSRSHNFWSRRRNVAILDFFKMVTRQPWDRNWVYSFQNGWLVKYSYFHFHTSFWNFRPLCLELLMWSWTCILDWMRSSACVLGCPWLRWFFDNLQVYLVHYVANIMKEFMALLESHWNQWALMSHYK